MERGLLSFHFSSLNEGKDNFLLKGKVLVLKKRLKNL